MHRSGDLRVRYRIGRRREPGKRVREDHDPDDDDECARHELDGAVVLPEEGDERAQARQRDGGEQERHRQARRVGREQQRGGADLGGRAGKGQDRAEHGTDARRPAHRDQRTERGRAREAAPRQALDVDVEPAHGRERATREHGGDAQPDDHEPGTLSQAGQCEHPATPQQAGGDAEQHDHVRTRNGYRPESTHIATETATPPAVMEAASPASN